MRGYEVNKSRRPISFIATLEPEKALVFYGEVLGLELIESSPYALVFSDDENMLRVQIVAEFCPATHTVHGWQVTNIEQDIHALVQKGVAFLIFDQLGQNASGVWTTPDGHKIAWFKDPSDNILSLTQFV
jgi:catechol 2,3-dioxygenase-like lactoylglutathione lyase family enzyme